MIQYPAIDPVIYDFGFFSPRWYGLMYFLAFLFGFYYLKKTNKKEQAFASENDIWDLLLFALLGLILGGRIGYILFYQFEYYFAHPWKIFAVYEGGLSFHGGLIGITAALYIYKKIKKFSLLKVGDLVSVPAAFGIMLGRIGNFINGELYGRATDSPLCMVFPMDSEKLCRHPSQLYESFLEGFLLFFILLYIKKKNYKTGTVSAVFLIGYGFFRFIAEFFRQPDKNIGFYFDYFTQGQLFSLPLIIFGLILLYLLNRQQKIIL